MASFRLKRLAEPRAADDSVKAMIRRVARLVGLPESRTEDLWRQEARLVRAEEMDAIRAAARKQEDARAELRTTDDLIARIEALEAALRVRDADFHGEDLAALVASRGGLDRTLDRGE